MRQTKVKNAKTVIFLSTLLLTTLITLIPLESVVKASSFTPPIIGDYQNVSVRLSGNVIVSPTAVPTNVVSITGSAPPSFKGQISVAPTTGVVRITNAYPTGTYSITITAFDNAGETATKTLTLTVQSSALCEQMDFKQAPTFTVSVSNQSVATADFDGDGKDDIATSNSVLRNTNIGDNIISFAPKVDFDGVASTLAVAAADFDGDGKKDIVTANFFSPDISVVRNTSTGAGIISFAPKINFSTGSNPRSVIAVDIDEDGKLDIVVANSGSNNISIFKNTSSGVGSINFAAPINLSVGSQPRSVAAGDFDADNKIDIATANYNSDTVSILRNTGQGSISFAPKVDFVVGTGGSNPSSLVSADFDGDGKQDIAATNNTSRFVSVLRNTSAGMGIISFASRVSFSSGFGGYGIIARDLDADGKQDLSAVNYYGNTVSILKNNSNTGSINFEYRQDFGVGQTPTAIAVGDFNGDGKTDLTVANSKSNNISVLKNISAGVVRFDARPEFGIGSSSFLPYSVAIADFDSDGRQDLITANNSSNNISVLRNLGAVGGIVRFNLPVEFPVGSSTNPAWVAVGDLDGDGKTDVVVANSNSGSVSILRNTSASQGTISFASPVNFLTTASPRFVNVGDFDSDGKLDLAVVNYNSNNISILRNTSPAGGTISFAPKIDFGVNTNPTSLVISDFDGDAKPDIAVTNFIGTTVSVLKNTSSATGSIGFAPKVDFTVNSNPYSVTAEDFDGDGKFDLAVSNSSNNQYIVSVLRNTSTGGSVAFAPKIDTVMSVSDFSVLHGQLITGDIDGNGKQDIIGFNQNGTNLITVLKNNSVGSGTINFSSRIDTDISAWGSSLAVGDFDNDGKQDVAFASYNSDNIGVLQNPCSIIQGKQFDYDGDGQADISVFRPSNSVWYLLRSQSGFSTNQFGISTDKITPADFDGDGRTDIAAFRDGIWYWLNSSNGGFKAVQFGQAGDAPVAADYTGDGRAELAVYRGGFWYTLNLANNQFSGVQFGNSTDKPAPADFDGDGKTDFAVYRDGTWYLLRSSQGFTTVQFGNAADKPTVGDYDGDGKADQAVYRAGAWYVFGSTQGFYSVQFGAATDVPVAADYDGDGRTDIAVFRDGGWFWLQSSNNQFRAVQFGTANDKPTPAAFVP